MVTTLAELVSQAHLLSNVFSAGDDSSLAIAPVPAIIPVFTTTTANANYFACMKITNPITKKIKESQEKCEKLVSSHSRR